MKKDIYLGKSAGWVKHTRNSDMGGRRGVNKKVRRNRKAEDRSIGKKNGAAEAGSDSDPRT